MEQKINLVADNLIEAIIADARLSIKHDCSSRREHGELIMTIDDVQYYQTWGKINTKKGLIIDQR